MNPFHSRSIALLLGLTALAGRGTAADGTAPTRPTNPRKSAGRSVVFYLPAGTKVLDALPEPKFPEEGDWLVRKGTSATVSRCAGTCFVEEGATVEGFGDFRVMVVKKGGTIPPINQLPVRVYCAKGVPFPEDLRSYRGRQILVEEFDTITFAPWKPFTLKGRVRDTAGKALVGIRVRVYGLSEQQIAEAITDRHGAFAFRPSRQVKSLAADLGAAWYRSPSYRGDSDLALRRHACAVGGWEAHVEDGFWGRDADVTITPPAPARVALPLPVGLLAHEWPITQVVFSGGNTLATVSEAGWPCLWDRDTGRELGRFVPHAVSPDNEGHRVRGYRTDPRSVALDRRGRFVTCFGPEGILSLWDAATGKLVHQLKGHRGAVRCAAFARGGRTLASGGADGTIRLYDVDTGKTRTIIPAHKSGVDDLLCSPDGKLLISSGLIKGGGRDLHLIYDGMRAWDATTGKAVWAFPSACERPVFSPDGELLAAVGVLREPDAVRRWSDPIVYQPLVLCESATGRRVAQIAGHQADTLAFTPDAQLLLTATAQSVRVWETATGQEILACPLPERNVTRLVFSHDGRTLAAGRADGTVSLWPIRPHHLYVPERRIYLSAEWDNLWTELASDRAATAYRALWTLRRSPRRAVTPLGSRLTPARELPLARWIADLDSDDFATRQAASRALVNSGDTAARALRRALRDKPTLEVRKRAEQILAEIDRRGPSHEDLRSWRALQLLEDVGSPEARAVLVTVSKGWPAARQTRLARAALARLAAR